jgi:hypothetical protein
LGAVLQIKREDRTQRNRNACNRIAAATLPQAPKIKADPKGTR